MMNEREAEEEFTEAGSEAIAEDVESLKQALAEEKEKAAANLAGWQRAQADFVNYKKRSEREKADLGKYANSELMLKLLPALDDLERALAAIPARQAKLSWVEGVRLIERKLRTILKGVFKDGKVRVSEEQGEGKEGVVVKEMQKGYRLHDRVIRPSKVVVGSDKEDEQGGEA